MPSIDSTASPTISVRKASLLRSALAGAMASGVFFLLCWLGAFLPIGPATHMYLQLFTNAELTSALALGQGFCWSVIFGFVAGALIALCHNLLAVFDGR